MLYLKNTMRCVCVRVCHFWGYYCIHVQIIKCQIFYFCPPDIAACHISQRLLFTDSHSVYPSLSSFFFTAYLSVFTLES